MVEKVGEDLDGTLNVREEGLAGRSEDVTDGVGGDLLLDGNARVNVAEELLKLVGVILDVKELLVVVVVDSTVGVGLAGGVERLDGVSNSLGNVAALCWKSLRKRSSVSKADIGFENQKYNETNHRGARRARTARTK